MASALVCECCGSKWKSTKIRTNQWWHAKQSLSGSVPIWHTVCPRYTNSPILVKWCGKSVPIIFIHITIIVTCVIWANLFWFQWIDIEAVCLWVWVRKCVWAGTCLQMHSVPSFAVICVEYKSKKQEKIIGDTLFIPSITLGGLEHHIINFV